MSSKLDRTLRLLVLANLAVIAVLAGTMAADWLSLLPTRAAVQSPDPSATGGDELMRMGLAHIPTSNACVLCHEGGGEGGLKVVPAIGHPREGWLQCLTCHTDESLGRLAPGHAGIPESECLNCHKEATDGPPITQAHLELGQPCLECHGGMAHLPTSMVGRSPDGCWLCHKPAPLAPPSRPHPVVTQLGCRACHQSEEVGALPINHVLRQDSTCVLCHTVPILDASNPPVPASPGTAEPTAPPDPEG
jgi:hypothetical protein